MKGQDQGITLRDQILDLAKIQVPSYIFSTREDHIAPWQAGYAGLEILNAQTKFVLGDSGHIAGVFNPPQAQKYQYWTYDHYSQDPELWLDQAQAHSGSWWTDWVQWLQPYLGEVVHQTFQNASPKVLKYHPLESAPGSYALRKGAA